MPELPEVETTLRGITPAIKGQCIVGLELRHTKLRWNIPNEIKMQLPHQCVDDISRRGKYLLFHTRNGTAIIHLGMSGSLRIVPRDTPPEKHDHFDLVFANFCLRYTDPRRFGALLWTQDPPEQHPLLRNLGLEPLASAFDGEYLYHRSRQKKITIKQFIMDHHIVVGVGNIYAAESLFLAGIHPLSPAKDLLLRHYQALAKAIKKVLLSAIKQGGTTLRNFQNSEGKPGYFKQKLHVYGREGQNCRHCNQILETLRIQNRATVFCPNCQSSR
jgi:formamidopyrimidine-DNA glycosylase